MPEAPIQGNRTATYRLYFVDKADHFRAAQVFEAPNDTEAVQIAELVHDACSDVAPHFELWRGAHPVATSRGRCPAPDLGTVIRQRQEQVLDLEDTLQRSHSSLARSSKLIDRSATLRQMIVREIDPQESSLSAS
ncbi:MAG TPA: hypothetical protein VFL96_05180 [Acidobacteriaceae bacterium]|jgi:hypothetical protein|nr:hypothetical protein [Acidobacteriaceae bacterium]